MEAVGQLAGGVAHDFNNLPQVILGHTYLLLMTNPGTSPEHSDADEIRKAAERAASLTAQLLAFSHRQVLTPVDLDLSLVVVDLAKMVRRVIGEEHRARGAAVSAARVSEGRQGPDRTGADEPVREFQRCDAGGGQDSD